MRVFRGYPLFTTHGFVIEGYYRTVYMAQPQRARCGGPKLCGKCKGEVILIEAEAKVNEEQAAHESMDRRVHPFPECPPECPKCKAERDKNIIKAATEEELEKLKAEFMGKWADLPDKSMYAGTNYQTERFTDTARRLVFDYIKPKLEKTDRHITFGLDEVYVVWFTYVLGSWKALVSTTLPDGMYYEVTHNGAENETYLDAYKKFDNILIKP